VPATQILSVFVLVNCPNSLLSQKYPNVLQYRYTPAHLQPNKDYNKVSAWSSLSSRHSENACTHWQVKSSTSFSHSHRHSLIWLKSTAEILQNLNYHVLSPMVWTRFPLALIWQWESSHNFGNLTIDLIKEVVNSMERDRTRTDYRTVDDYYVPNPVPQNVFFHCEKAWKDGLSKDSPRCSQSKLDAVISRSI
jgi:hypothetical protein